MVVELEKIKDENKLENPFPIEKVWVLLRKTL
jgi:hypothetical protein